MPAEAAPQLLLYDYWRSTAAYRVRIALHLKGLAFEQRSVNLVQDGGQQHKGAYRAVNPQGLVPTLVHGEHAIHQSLAICEYLDETFPQIPLLPQAPVARARVRAMAMSIACDVHPLNNLRVQQYLKGSMGVDEGQALTWMQHWMHLGFAALEAELAKTATTACCAGDSPGLADIVLVAQAYNADRFNLPMTAYPTLQRIIAHCSKLPAFVAAAPAQQADAPQV